MKQVYLYFFVFLFVQCNSVDSSNVNVISQEQTVHQVIQFFTENATDTAKINSFWEELKSNSKIPYTFQDTALFLFKGDATTVQWNGDFNSWGQNNSFKNNGAKISGTNIFYLKSAFPSDARLDYKIVINSNWMLDPNNTFQQWSGFGPNSELRMPDYESSLYKELIPGVREGTLSSNYLINSSSLNYSVNYKVWTPNGYDNTAETPYPVLYVTDGHEYADSRLGALPIIAANLIADASVEPFLIVFISPLNPSNSNQNRRQSELVLNEAYSTFIIQELIPQVESNYAVSKKAEDRGILGTSLGGIMSTYMMASQANYFKRIGIHSPAYWYRDQIFDLVNQLNESPKVIFMSTGTIGDTEDKADQMKTLFDTKKWNYSYLKVNEGHSWGNWSGIMDETLMALFPAKNSTSIERN